MITLPRQKPNLFALLDDTDALIHNAETYFNNTDPPHTPAGLALALGFSSFAQLKTIMVTRLKHIIDFARTDIDTTPTTPNLDTAYPDYPDTQTQLLSEPPLWLHVITTAFSIIEDDYVRNALLDEYRASTVQHLINAYFDVIARSKSENQTNITQQSDSRIQIILPDTKPPENQPEINRLKKALPQINQLDTNSAPTTHSITEEELNEIL